LLNILIAERPEELEKLAKDILISVTASKRPSSVRAKNSLTFSPQPPTPGMNHP